MNNQDIAILESNDNEYGWQHPDLTDGRIDDLTEDEVDDWYYTFFKLGMHMPDDLDDLTLLERKDFLMQMSRSDKLKGLLEESKSSDESLFSIDKSQARESRPFFEHDGRLVLTTLNSRKEHLFCYLDGETIISIPSFRVGNIDIFPQQLPSKNGDLVKIVGIPDTDLLLTAPLVESRELYSIIEEHLKKYLDASPLDIELFTYYSLFTWLYPKLNTVAYLRIIADTGKGKSRHITVIGDLCFYPINADGASSPSGIMRFKEKWHGTLKVDEADIQNNGRSNGGGHESELIKYINLGFERGKYFIKSDKNNPKDQDIFDPFCPKIFGMREHFKDNATEARCLSFSPKETTRKDIPIILPESYTDEVAKIRATIARFVLQVWGSVKGDNFIDCSSLDVEPRLKQLLLPLSIVLQVLPDGRDRFITYIMRRQLELKKARAESYDGTIFNTLLDLAIGEIVVEDKYRNYINSEGLPEIITSAMIADILQTKTTIISQAVKRMDLDIESRKINIEGKWRTVKGVVVPDEASWREVIQRYYYREHEGSDQTTLIQINEQTFQCPENLRGRRYITV